MLPDFLDEVHIQNLIIGDALLDLRLFRSNGSAAAVVERRIGEIEVLVLR